MANYTKERNIIIINLDGASGAYRLDINTGIFYGVKGNPVKTFPRHDEARHLLPCYRDYRAGSNLEYVLHYIFANYNRTSDYLRYASAMMSADRLDSAEIPNLHPSLDNYAYLGENIKYLVAYGKEHDFNRFDMGEFRAWCEFEKVRNKLGAVANQLTAKMYEALRRKKQNITVEQLSVCAYYLVRGKYWEYHHHNVENLIQYLNLCECMGKTPEKVNNFMREYCETQKTYELRKKEFDNKKMALSYANHAKAWEFEYGDFIVSIPTCGQDIVDEGDNMHHCVGGYVDRVVEGRTYICFIRRKATPNECYLTCQVDLEGNIRQYYLAYDRCISSDEDIAFKTAYQNHLREVWDN